LGDWAEEVEGRPSDNDVCLGWLPVVREDAATTTTTQEGGGEKALFGTELQELAQREGRPVPAVISDAISYIERHGLQAVGLFRIDVTSLMNNLTRDIDAGQPIDLDAIANPHAAANIIKRFLRQIGATTHAHICTHNTRASSLTLGPIQCADDCPNRCFPSRCGTRWPRPYQVRPYPPRGQAPRLGLICF
jgi:hypothetical protein